MKKLILPIILLIILTLLVLTNNTLFLDNINISFSSTLRLLATYISYLCNPLVLIIISLIIFILNKKIGLSLFTNLTVTAILNSIIKIIIQRDRPINLNSYSFPSCHAMISISFYGFIIYYIYKSKLKYKKILIILLSILILLIGISRIILNVHYVTDVLTGYLIGYILLILFINKYKNNLCVKNIFIDIDGTLTNDNQKITFLTKIVFSILKIININTILCSGRANNYTISKSKKSNACKYVISCNGALIYNYKTNEIIFGSEIDKKMVKKVFDKCNELETGVILNSLNERYCNKYLIKEKVCDIITIEDVIDKPIYQLVIRSYDLKKINEISEYIKGKLQVTNASSNFYNQVNDNKRIFLDVTNKNINKGVGINNFNNYSKTKYDYSMCFGDHINDLPMFLNCKYKIAMKNAKDNLKEKSNYITKTNNKSGVACFILKHII